MTENKRARQYWVKATGGQLKVPVEINSNEFDNIDLTTGDDRWIYTVIQTVDPTTNPTSMKQKWLHLIEYSEVERLESKLELMNQNCISLSLHESRMKRLEEKNKMLVDAVTILIDDAAFFTGDVRKLTAFERLKQALKQYEEIK